jgi:hypothetical protein
LVHPQELVVHPQITVSLSTVGEAESGVPGSALTLGEPHGTLSDMSTRRSTPARRRVAVITIIP